MRCWILLLIVFMPLKTFAGQPQAVYEGSGSGMPKQPQAWISSDNVVHLAFGVGEQVYYARTEQSSFASPQAAFRIPNMSLGMRRGPRIVATQHSIVVTAIGGAQGKGRDGEVLAYRSLDKGQTWDGPVKVNDTEASAREGLHAMTCSDDGTCWCVWLDLRNKRTELYVSKSNDGGLTWSKNALLYQSPEKSICECCHPSIVARGQALHTLFRNSLRGHRDMYTVSSVDGGTSFNQAVRLGMDHWELNACPMDGGMLAVNDAGAMTAVWRRGGTIYASQEKDEAEIPLGKGEQSWVAIAGDQPHIVWTKSREGDLLYSKLDDQPPQKLADNARDPIVVAGRGPKQLVMAFWESRHGEKTIIKCQALNE